MRISDYFVSKSRAGEPAYYDGRQRGTVAIYWDSKLYLYRQPADRSSFKNALRSEFCGEGEKFTGKWPEYRVD